LSEERVRERFYASYTTFLVQPTSMAASLLLNLSGATGIVPTACQWHLLGQVEVRKERRAPREIVRSAQDATKRGNARDYFFVSF
jgi:hypothetical protein